jgi:triosephosphate isomerase
MYFGLAQTRNWLRKVADLGPVVAELGIDAFVIPDFLSIIEAVKILEPTPLLVGAQDVFWRSSGPYTGEVSPTVLREAGCTFAEIGHAERRRIFHEDNAIVADKAAAAADAGLVPLVCIGETGSFGVASAVDECTRQIEPIMAAVSPLAELVLAYEPVWAIGADRPASAEHIVAVARRLRELTKSRPGLTRILYGGSAGPGMFEFIAEGVDGLFLGRHAHDVQNFRSVLHELATDAATEVA